MRSRAAVMGVVISGLIILAVASGPLTAATQAGGGVAIVDNGRVFEESNPGKAATQQITAAANALQSQIATSESELQGLLSQRQQQAGVMSAEARGQLDTQIEQKRIDLQRQRDDAQRQFDSNRNRVLSDLETRITPALGALAQELGYQVVFNSQTPGLLYAAPSVDITDQFIARINAAADEDR